MANEGASSIPNARKPFPGGNEALRVVLEAVSRRIHAPVANTTALAALTDAYDGMVCFVGAASKTAYHYVADAESGSVAATGMGEGYWNIATDADVDALAALAAAGGAALVGLTDTNSKITGSTLQALVNELTTTTGGAMVGIADAGSHYTATDVEAALQEIGLIRVRKLQLQITHADLTDAVNGEAQAINIGAALPANAWVLGRPDVLLTTQFTGGSATEVDLDIGVAGAIKSLLGDLDVLASTASGAHYNIGDAAGTREGGYFGGSQLIATFTPDGSHDLADLDAGDLTITVLYVVMA